MNIKDINSLSTVLTHIYPREKYGEIKGKNGIYFVYCEGFERSDDHLVMEMYVPSLNLKCQATLLNAPFKLDRKLIAEEMFESLILKIERLPYA